MLELKQSNINTTKIMTATIVLSAIFIISTLANNNIFAKEITKEFEIINHYANSIYYDHNKAKWSNVDFVKWPPGEVDPIEGMGKFEISFDDTNPLKTPSFKIQYDLESNGNSPKYVAFGFKVISDNGRNIFHCSAETNVPAEIKSSYKDCDDKIEITEYIVTQK